jgi:hypothetical protein
VELRTLRYFVTVAEELHFSRAAARLHIRQPPLSRAIKQLEAEVGAVLFDRSPAGVSLTPTGEVLLDEARALLDQADRVRARMAVAAGAAVITVGILGDSSDPGIARLASAFRRRHPRVEVRIRETDLTDPTCGLRTGLVPTWPIAVGSCSRKAPMPAGSRTGTAENAATARWYGPSRSVSRPCSGTALSASPS